MQNHRNILPALLFVILALLVIGCGGGGDGSGTSTDSTTATASGTATATATASATATTATSATTATTATSAGTGSTSIVYGTPNGQGSNFDVKQISPSGTNNVTLIPNVSGSILIFAVNPALPTEYVFAADPNGSGLYGIYRSVGLTLTGATTLVAPVYTEVTSIAVTQNGSKAVYTAVDGSGVDTLFAEPLTGGSPTGYGVADGAAVSPADNDTVAYVAPSAANADIDQVFLRTLSAGPAGPANQLTTVAANHVLPAFSRDGLKLAFWEEQATSNRLLVFTIAIQTSVALPNPNNVFPQGEAFSPDGARLAIAADNNGTGQILNQTTDGTSPPAVILSATGALFGNYGIFWRDASGRAIGGSSGMSSVSRLRKHRRTP
ncbi:hypothetical protein [Fimbriimonas ginsengisoli]|uniref:Uncharacterized protein n=1 Tax=Fimbriimonas ginsengisoli Gsoil 348 TaxID=661478 RepID=A0A068NNM0_FIMGI|nr:hypothetical protein [Fimbriimonas ginsengisoli]AIE84355.1 hypothetical protein OP10G_0987 [Fimbriimonas ginsengisoli Gsoil 348]